jgi:prepilin-type N-terminal cleavage/methylation domain-containing protein
MQVTQPRIGRYRGFTLIEIVLVTTILGVMAAILMPPLRTTFSANTRHAARREALSYIYKAQAVAVQQSRRSYLVRNGNTLKVLVDSSGTKLQQAAVLDLRATFGATIAATPSDTISFDPRGFALLSGATAKLVLTIGTSSVADTVCVTGLSRIATRSCP